MTQLGPSQLDHEVVRFAGEVGSEGPVAVAGGQTRWHLGGEVDPTARILRAPVGVIGHRPAEMTVQVRAGTAVAQLHAELAAAGQQTALPDRSGTVGGALSVGEDDLMVRTRGRVRTALLQARYVAADGQIVTAGGPTVK